jgi:hypothetical protein
MQGHRQKSPQAAHFVLRREPLDVREVGRPAHTGRGGEVRPFSAERADCEVATAWLGRFCVSFACFAIKISGIGFNWPFNQQLLKVLTLLL